MKTNEVAVPANNISTSPAPGSRREFLLHGLRTMTARMLRIAVDEVDVGAPFLEMGADSLVITEVVRIIQATYGLKLSVRQFFEETTTIGQLARFIDDRLPEGWSGTTETAPPVAPSPPAHVTTLPPVAPPPVASASPPPVAPASPLPVATGARPTAAVANGRLSLPRGDLTGLLMQQLQVVSQLISSQVALLSGRSLAGDEVSPAPALPANPATAAPPPPAGPPLPRPVASPPPVAPNPSSDAAAAAKVASRGLTELQKQHLDGLVERYTRRTQRSKELTQRYRMPLADSRATVGFRFSTKEMLYPIVGQRASGSRIWDVDGNEYIDLTMGFGVHLFGNRPPFVSEVLRDELTSGVDLGPRSPVVGEVAELFCRLTGHERVAFCNSGTEAVMTAIRLARARTGRSRIAIFAGSYHGHSDGTLAERGPSQGPLESTPVSPGIPLNVAADVVVLEYNSAETLQLLRTHGKEFAAVLVEPVQSRHLDLQPVEFLRELRQITRESGTALMFDEMITGFRVHPGGSQGLFGIQADLATYGKIVGGGMPIGVVAGRAEFLNGIDGGPWQYGDRSFPKEEMTFFGGTFCQHPLAMVAARAVLQRLITEGPALQQRLGQLTADFARAANEICYEYGAPIRITHFGSQFRFTYSGNMDLLFYHLLERGIYIWEWRNCFLSAVHTPQDLAFVLNAIRESLAALREGGFLDVAGLVPVDSPLRSKTSPAAMKNSGAPISAPAPAGRQSAPAAPPAASAGGGEVAATPAIPPFIDRRRGVVRETRGENAPGAARSAPRRIEFSLSYFGKYDAEFRRDKYDLLFESCRWADEHGFTAAWVPERHFHSFGGLSPNPSLLAAALARTTRNLKLRAGSVVLPLHNPIRVAEEWAVVDNLSGGRVGVALASGWHPDDFVFAPHHWGQQREVMLRDAELIQRLWRGDVVRAPGGTGSPVDIRLHPLPLQRELPLWLTIVNNPDTYVKAGQLGFSVLTNLMGQTHEELARNIGLYRQALTAHGWAPERGHVTVLIHTFITPDAEAARQAARRPFNDYLQSSIGLFRNLAKSAKLDIDVDRLTAEDREFLCDKAFERYLDNSVLIGSPDSCAAVVRQLAALGVDEIAAFIDFGVNAHDVLDNLHCIDEVRQHFHSPAAAEPAGRAPELGSAVLRRPLLPSQEQMWVLAQINPEGAISYTDLVAIELQGDLELPALRTSLQELVRRHEALRSWIDEGGGEQLVARELTVELPIIALADGAAAQQWLRTHSAAPIQLHRAPGLQVHLLAMGDRRQVLVLRAHHAFVDGWSLGVLVEELAQLYTAARQGTPPALPPCPQFGDFMRWQTDVQRQQQWADDEAYWLAQLRGDLPTLALPADRPRPAVRSFRGERQTLRLDAPHIRAVNELSRKLGCTPFMTFLALYLLWLHRLCQQQSLLVGIAVSGRPPELSENLVGSMSQILPIRLDAAAEGSFTELLLTVRGLVLSAFEHQAFPFARLVQKLGAGRDLSRAPLINAVFNYDRPLQVPRFGELTASALPRDIGYARYDLYLNVMSIGSEVEIECDYSTDLFDSASVRRYLAVYMQLLEQVCAAPSRRLWEYSLVDGEDAQRLLGDWNATARGDADTVLVHRQIEAWAKQTPDAIAVVAELAEGSAVRTQTLSYAELDRRASRLAAVLRARGVGPESRVAFLAPHSPELVIGLLGILKAGAAFLPLDPASPENRLAWMVNDSGARLLVTVRAATAAFPALSVERIYVDALDEYVAAAPAPGADVGPGNLAYVMYTSGSTGHPKGVMITHAGFSDYLRWCLEVYPTAAGEGTPLHGSIAFDATLTSIFPALCTGRSVFVFPDDHAVAGLLRALRGARRYSFVKLTPSHLAMLDALSPPAGLEDATGALILGGEALTEAVLAPWKQRAPHLRIFNEYGPTEAVVGCALHEGWDCLPLSGGAPIGRPAKDTLLYVLDEHMQLLPPGVAGELYIGGTGVARGYTGAPGLTAQRFVPNPFAGSSPGARPGGRLYRTGDRARWLPSGVLEFLGRIDDQVKLRGFRIELGEIGAVLGHHPRVQNAVAVLRGEQLVAYAATDAAGTSDEAALHSALREQLSESLPAYMLPTELVLLRALPLTSNGKIATAQLPAPGRRSPQADPDGRPPRNELEELVAAVWRELLGIERLGIHQNFFDLGGHSALVVRMHRRLGEATGRSLDLVQIFRHPTVAALATLLGAPEPPGTAAGRAEDMSRVSARRRALQSHRERAERQRS